MFGWIRNLYQCDDGGPMPVFGRAPGWTRLAKEWLAANPYCVVCGKTVGVVPHHVSPVHLHPDIELSWNNLITLCPRDHLLIGHLGLWISYNPTCVTDAREWASKIKKRP